MVSVLTGLMMFAFVLVFFSYLTMFEILDSEKNATTWNILFAVFSFLIAISLGFISWKLMSLNKRFTRYFIGVLSGYLFSTVLFYLIFASWYVRISVLSIFVILGILLSVLLCQKIPKYSLPVMSAFTGSYLIARALSIMIGDGGFPNEIMLYH